MALKPGKEQLSNQVYQAPLFQKVNNYVHRIKHYPLDSAIGFAKTYPADGPHPLFEQLPRGQGWL